MRLFLAVVPPTAVQARAAGVVAGLRSPGDGVSWVRPENVHVTLRFLGEFGADGARRAADAAREAATAHAPFEAGLTVPGAFPDARRARVLWLGVGAGSEAMCALARTLEQALRSRGFDRPDRPFAPHLTLGRVRTSGDWAARLAAVAPLEARFRVERIVLVESTLSPGGSRYEVRERAPLAATP